MLKINETKAFGLIKKAKRPGIYKDEYKYYVTDGYFAFETTKRDKLLALGLVSFNGEVEKQHDYLREVMSLSKAQMISAKFTGLYLGDSAIITSGKGLTAVNRIYLDLFTDPLLMVEIKTPGTVYLFSGPNDVLQEALILPLRPASPWEEQISKVMEG